MERDMSDLSLDQLKEIYHKADEDLKTALLNGTPWEEVRAKRKVVTELSKLIFKKRSSNTPADTQLR
jgi:hypothetical protein